MKRSLILVLLAFLPLIVRAQDPKESWHFYLDADQLPDACIFLPPPPADTSTRFMYDITWHLWAKQQRGDPDRAATAVRQAVGKPDKMAVQFSKAFGMELSEAHCPTIMHMLRCAVYTAREAATGPKDTYKRLRPYVKFNEHTLIPQAEEGSRDAGSFPSGHTVRAVAMALLLIEINPDAQNDLMRLAYEWGESRIIAGYHWQSDVDASYPIAAAAIARLHADPVFLADMAAAKAEYRRLLADDSSN